MSELAVMSDHHYRQQYQVLMADRAEPEFLRELRRAGIERFERLGMPGSRWEAWRFTDLSGFASIEFEHAGAVPVASDQIPAALSATGPRLVFVNGRYAPSLSHLADLPKGVVICGLAQALRERPALVEAHLSRLPGLSDQPFVALNDAMFQDGGFIYVPAGKVLKQPVDLVFWNVSHGQPGAAYPRTLIVLEEGAQADVVETYTGDGGYFCCPQSELRLAQGAVCRYHKLQLESAAAYHLGGLRLQLVRDSHAKLHLISTSGKLNRTDLHAQMDGPGADCEIDGLILVRDGELGDYHLQLEHAQPLGTSRQLFKSVLEGKSRAVFDGLIKVVKDAQQTNASQTSRNLLLSKRAVASANPRLEILADDVKCAHGTTVGYLDPDAMFYLRARGVAEAQARAMLVYAFANEQIEHIKLEALRERLEHLLHARFYPEPELYAAP